MYVHECPTKARKDSTQRGTDFRYQAWPENATGKWRGRKVTQLE